MKRILFFLLIFLSELSFSQNGSVVYTSTGMSLSMVNLPRSFFLDADTVWMGLSAATNNSVICIFKFDGNNFTRFNIPNTVNHSNINAFEKDNSGNLWIGTNAALLLHRAGVFSPATFTLSNTYIRSLKYHNGNMWIGTNGGLFKYDGSTIQAFTKANSGIPSDTVTAIEIDNAGIFWLACSTKFTRFDGIGNFTIVHTFNNPVGRINDIEIDARNRKWIAASSLQQNSVHVYDAVMENFNQKYLPVGSIRPDNGVLQLCTGRDNKIAIPCLGGFIEVGMDDNISQYKPQTTSSFIAYHPVLNKYVNYRPVSGEIKVCYFDPSLYDPLQSGVIYSYDNIQFLDVNEVKALVSSDGKMHSDFGGTNRPRYEVPKGSMMNSLVGTACWFGGFDSNNQYRVIDPSKIYLKHGFIDPVTTVTDSFTMALFNRVWKIDYRDLDDFITNYNAGNVQNGTYTPQKAILDYPAKGNHSQAIDMAPFVDVDGDGLYQPLLSGDHPKLTGDQMLYYVFNDQTGTHKYWLDSCQQMNIEVQATAYAYGCPQTMHNNPELNYTTFYRYQVINRGTEDYHDCNIAMNVGARFGCTNFFSFGCNVPGNFAYNYKVYSADTSSCYPGHGLKNYGSVTPVQSMQVMKGPVCDNDGIDNDNDGLFDEAGEEAGMNSFTIIYDGGPFSTYPSKPIEYNYYMNSRDYSGGHITCADYVTLNDFMYYGNPYPNSPCGNAPYWSSTYVRGSGVLSSGNFNLNAGDTVVFEYAFITTFDSVNTSLNPADIIAKNVIDNMNVKNFYRQQNKPTCLQNAVGIKEINRNDDLLQLYPNPATAEINITYYNPKLNKTHQLEVYNTTGQLVLSDELKTNVSKQINTQALPPGVYIIRVKGANGYSTQRFVKQ